MPTISARFTRLGLLFCIVAGFYWKLVFTYQYDWVAGGDMAQQVLPWFDEEARQIQHSHFPLWDPHSWMGQPMLGQGQPGAAYPLNWILFLMPRRQGHMQFVFLQWYFVAIHYMAALFAYLLCRDLGRSQTASLAGGLIFGLGAYVGTTDWPQMVNGAVWAPLVFLFLLRALRGYRPLASAALSGLCLGIAWLSGHHQVPIYITLASAGVWLFYILRNRRPNWNLAFLAAVSMSIMVLTGALQTVPAVEYGHFARRWAGATDPLAWNQPVPYYVHQRYSLSPLSLFSVVFPSMYSHSDPFIGLVAFVLVLCAIALYWKEHVVKLFSCLAVASVVYALGFHSVFQGFLYATVPMIEKARVPAMALAIYSIAVAVLAAFGLDRFASEPLSPWTYRISAGTLVFGLVTCTLIFAIFLSNKLAWEFDDRIAITMFVSLLLAALLYAWRTGDLSRNQACASLLLLMLLELGNTSGSTFAARSDAGMRAPLDRVLSNDDIAAFLKRHAGPFRIEMKTDRLVSTWGTYHDLDVIEASGASAPSNVLEIGTYKWNTRMLLGVRYSIGEKPEMPEQKEAYSGSGGLKVYENPNAFPRAWTIHEIVPVKTVREGELLIQDHLNEMRWKAFMTDAPPRLTQCPDARDQVSFDRNDPERIELRAQMGCDGMLVVSDTFYPGWVASVDGKPGSIYEVNGAMRGVLVSKGSHRIAMRYRPKSVYLGAALTGVGLLGAVVIASKKSSTGGNSYTTIREKNVF